MDTAGKERVGWTERVALTFTLSCGKQTTRRKLLCDTGSPTGVPWQRRGVRWEGWEGGSRGKGYMCTYGWFMLMYGRKQRHCKAITLHLGKKEFVEIHRTRRSVFCNPDGFQSHFNYSLSTEEYHLYVITLTFPTCTVWRERQSINIYWEHTTGKVCRWIQTCENIFSTTLGNTYPSTDYKASLKLW